MKIDLLALLSLSKNSNKHLMWDKKQIKEKLRQ